MFVLQERVGKINNWWYYWSLRLNRWIRRIWKCWNTCKWKTKRFTEITVVRPSKNLFAPPRSLWTLPQFSYFNGWTNNNLARWFTDKSLKENEISLFETRIEDVLGEECSISFWTQHAETMIGALNKKKIIQLNQQESELIEHKNSIPYLKQILCPNQLDLSTINRRIVDK